MLSTPYAPRAGPAPPPSADKTPGAAVHPSRVLATGPTDRAAAHPSPLPPGLPPLALSLGFPCGATGKSLPVQEMEETWVRSLGWGDPLEEQMTTPSNHLAWKIPWTEEPGGL